MDKIYYLYPFHLPGIPVIIVDLRFPIRAIYFFLDEGKEAF
ncbi:MAG: hypothetical protein Q7W45_16695 [Bacteroidota bacterium]|nr:hypothetical protein [Bacteroidota bacterium]